MPLRASKCNLRLLFHGTPPSSSSSPAAAALSRQGCLKVKDQSFLLFINGIRNGQDTILCLPSPPRRSLVPKPLSVVSLLDRLLHFAAFLLVLPPRGNLSTQRIFTCSFFSESLVSLLGDRFCAISSFLEHAIVQIGEVYIYIYLEMLSCAMQQS